jgi:citrate lyase subunit beta/citryl-CoA lyase
LLADDVKAVVSPALAGVWLPKCGGNADLLELDAVLSEAERAAGVSRRTPVVALVETGAGVLALPQIAGGARVVHVGLGEVDLAADLGVEPGPAGEELGWARARLVVACSAAGLEAPIAPVSADFRDLASLRNSSVALRRQGYWGRAAINPAQVAVINEVFTVSEEDLAAAAAVVGLYEEALAAGEGVAVDAAGRMVDEAVVKVARRVLSRAAVSARREG